MNHVSSLTALILDHRPQYLASSPRSLLTLPMGRSSLLQHLNAQVTQSLGAHSVTIVPTFEMDQEYRAAVQRIMPGVAIKSANEARDRLGDLEPSDWVLIVDPSVCPAEGLDFGRLGSDSRDARTATHLIALATGAGLAGERVQVDGQSRIRRIQRWYSGITDLRASGVVATILPVSSLRTLDEFPSLTPTELRQQLTKCGVPIRDVTSTGTALNLLTQTQMLRFNMLFLERDVGITQPGESRSSENNSVWQKPGAWISPSARLYGPVILGEGCRIEAEAVIIGPVIVGRNARIGTDAIVANAILDDDSAVSPRSTVCDRVVCGISGSDQTLIESGEIRQSGDGASGGTVTSPNTTANASDLDVQFAVKRCLDFVLAALGLLLLSPLLLLTAALVKLTSRGPVLFGHIREGRNGREFKCMKFRTMVADAHARQRELYGQSNVDGPQFKLAHDPRVTWLGEWLRSTNIDELPQLINVLLGQMSLIGPRPSPFRENQICIPWRKARLSVRPGITGLWQVCRHERSVGDFHQWIHYDMLYVRRWSLRLDIGILMATVATFGGRFGVPVNWLIPEAKADEDATNPVFEFNLANRHEWSDLCLPAGNRKNGKDLPGENGHNGENGSDGSTDHQPVSSFKELGVDVRFS